MTDGPRTKKDSTKKPHVYTYSPLCDLFDTEKTHLNEKMFVYGVICQPVERQNGEKLRQLVQITDDSLEGTDRIVHVNLFSSEAEAEAVERLFFEGRVIRIHRAYLQFQSSSLVCIGGLVTDPTKKKGFLSWVLFDEKKGAVVKASSNNFTVSKEDKERVPHLIEWYSHRATVRTAVRKSPVPVVVAPHRPQKPTAVDVPSGKSHSNTSAPPSVPLLRLAGILPSNQVFSCVVYVRRTVFLLLYTWIHKWL